MGRRKGGEGDEEGEKEEIREEYIHGRCHKTRDINPFQSNFSANRILPSSYLLWAGKRLVDYLLAKVRTT